MKHKILLFSALITLGTSVQAQYTTMVTENFTSCASLNANKMRVRDWPGTKYALTYSQLDVGGVFQAIDHSAFTGGGTIPLPLFEVKIPSNLSTVGDFRIIGDYVCFHGIEYTGIAPYYSASYLGFFDINDLFSGGMVNYKLIAIQDGGVERIEGFCDSYGFKVFAIGTHREIVSGQPRSFYAIYEVDNPPIATGYICRYTTVSQQEPWNEFFEDIVVLDDRVVFVCSHHFYSTLPYGYFGPIEMRWVHKSSGINDLQIDRRYYQTSTAPLPEREINSRIQAKPISGDQFVICYTNSNQTSGVSTRRVRVFDANLDNINSQEFSMFSKEDMYEMAYNRRNETLTVLEPDGVSSRFVFVHPLTASAYTALTLNDPDNVYFSLDTVSSKELISVRDRGWLLQYADRLSANPSVTTNACLDNGEEKVTIIPSLEKKDFPDVLSILFGGLDNPENVPVISCSVDVICISY